MCTHPGMTAAGRTENWICILCGEPVEMRASRVNISERDRRAIRQFAMLYRMSRWWKAA
jgi:hypothetical protein